jgi:hypothetical protein
MIFDNLSNELDQFKTRINLIDYATSFGYSIDKQESSRSNVVMRDSQNDKVIITRHLTTQHWLYWSDRDNLDKGTIIDFLQRRRRLSLGEVRKELRSWTGTVESVNYSHHLVESQPNLDLMLRDYRKTRAKSDHPYLLNQRKIPLTTLSHPKFAGRIRIDSRSNAIFPHFDSGQVCGYEIKNSHFTSFAPHGQRRLWCSVYHPSNQRIIITESAIDALSFHALHGNESDFYLSIGGQLGKKQLSLIQRLLENISGVLVLAFDNDLKGNEYFQILDDFLNGSITITRLLPIAKDWNDDLRSLIYKS